MKRYFNKKRDNRNFKDSEGKSSWNKVGKWYGKLTEGKGHYYHEHVVIPNVLRLLNLKDNSKVLDLGSGSGILGRSISDETKYLGIDLANSLTQQARRSDKNISHEYITGNATKTLSLSNDFTHVAMILSLQNMQNGRGALENASKHLIKNGVLVIVLNHPVLRIPRQSSWEIDPQTKLQYRRIDKYLSPMQIPINMNPSDRNSATTWSHHYSISDYSKMLKDAGFVIELIEEWTSDKESKGRAAKMENRAREEFPLFMAIKAKKLN